MNLWKKVFKIDECKVNKIKKKSGEKKCILEIQKLIKIKIKRKYTKNDFEN